MKEENYEYLYHLINDCEFEDGMSNAAIEFLLGFFKEDYEQCREVIMITYKYYADDFEFLGKLCRCFCQEDVYEWLYVDILCDICKLCIKSDDAYCQEAGIMLCKKWRDIYGLALLALHLKPCNKKIKEYADSVIHELDLEWFGN